MKNTAHSLNEIESKFSDESFLENKGLSNEVGIYIHFYPPKDEIIIRNYFDTLKCRTDVPYNIIECDLYKIFLKICEDKHILKSIPSMEEKKGGKYLLAQLQKVATPEAFIERMNYSPHKKGDILLITGVGKVYPFMRAHNILYNIQHIFSDIPVVMLYPGTYNGQDLRLFDKFFDGNYYRAFNLL